jgi:hypothetical protein
MLFNVFSFSEHWNFTWQHSCQQDSVVLGSALPPDVEGEGWQGSTLQATLAFSFTIAFLPYWLHLWFYLVFGKIFYSCHGGKGNKILKENLSQEFVN